MYGYLAAFMLKRHLKTEPGEPFINFIRQAHECKDLGLPEGDHSLHFPGNDEDSETPEVDAGSGDEDDMDDLRELVNDWADGDEDTLQFPNYFGRDERRMLHQLCEELGYHHSSVGEGRDRRLVIYRSTVPSAPSSFSIERTVCAETGIAGEPSDAFDISVPDNGEDSSSSRPLSSRIIFTN